MRNTVHWKIKNSIMNDLSQLKETIFQTKSNVSFRIGTNYQPPQSRIFTPDKLEESFVSSASKLAKSC